MTMLMKVVFVVVVVVVLLLVVLVVVVVVWCWWCGGGGRGRLWIRSSGSRGVSELVAVDVRDVGYKESQCPLHIYIINTGVYHKYSSLNAMNISTYVYTYSECPLACLNLNDLTFSYTLFCPSVY